MRWHSSRCRRGMSRCCRGSSSRAGMTVACLFPTRPRLLCMTLLPPVMAVAGYAFFLAGLDNYYYLSLMPSVVLTVVLALTLPGNASQRWTRPVAWRCS